MNSSPILSVAQIRELDKRAIEEFGMPSQTLMRNAGEGIARAAAEIICRRRLHSGITIVAGKGNNGGDGYAAALQLAERGLKSVVLSLFRAKDLSKDAAYYYRKAKANCSIRMLDASTETSLGKILPLLKNSSLIVDALLGTGFKGEPGGLIAQAIDGINRCRGFVIAADVPSGLDAATGKARKVVHADMTVTMGFCKAGFLLDDAMNYIGALRVVDIGIPKALRQAAPRDALQFLDDDTVATWLPSRPRISHKGRYGHVLVVGGSAPMSGAPLLCARAALRTGSGLVTVACPEAIRSVVASGCAEAMTLGLPASQLSAVKLLQKAIHDGKFSAMVLGPGLGRSENTQSFVVQALKTLDIPIVVDADALFAIANKRFDMKTAKSKDIIITPHGGEFAQLLQWGKEEIKSDLWGKIKILSHASGAVVVAKSHFTAIDDGNNNIFVSFLGNAGMATAGMGDVLAGVIASLSGQGLKSFDAARAGVYIHGLAGDLAAVIKGKHGLIASDVIESIPQAMLNIV